MKVITSSMMAEIESQAYSQGFKDIDFMEEAGRGIAEAASVFIQTLPFLPELFLLCGKGNNGGDAFAAGSYLLKKGFKVTAIQLNPLDQCSFLCKKNGIRFLEEGGKIDHEIPSLPKNGLILDGLFGTGFKGIIQAPYDALIKAVNGSHLPILSIDIPSGLNGSTGESEGPVIHATETVFLGLPKTGFFLRDGWNATGKLQGVDFGLPKELIEKISAPFHLLTQEKVSSLLPPIKRNRHKYQAGYVMGLAGFMPGAALLSSLAAFRGGCGMVRLLYPEGMENAFSSSFYELIKIPSNFDQPQELLSLLNQAAASFIGPGMGKSPQNRALLENILFQLEKPCVMDADALTLFAENPFQLPPQVIMTPHTGEMKRLLKSSTPLILQMDLLEKCQSFAEKNKTTLILKGAPTFIFHPASPIYVNATGDPGMAAAGSGDVLTGLLASLLSQGLSCHDAALAGVFLHGLAGEHAARSRGSSRGMMASDLITHFASAYQSLESLFSET